MVAMRYWFALATALVAGNVLVEADDSQDVACPMTCCE